MNLLAERLTQEAFAPYGDVIAVPVRPGRKYYSSGTLCHVHVARR